MKKPIKTYLDFTSRLGKAMHAINHTRHNSRAVRTVIEDKQHCPLTALCYAETGNRFRTEEWEEAAEALNIEYDLALEIIAAADQPGHTRHYHLRGIMETGPCYRKAR